MPALLAVGQLHPERQADLPEWMPMSMGMDSQWLLRHQTREMLRKADRAGACLTHPTADHGPESDLQDQIEAECRLRQWAVVRTRMDKATTFTMKGVPDFVIAADAETVLWIECKSATGKQTPEQKGFEVLLTLKGHSYHLVRSLKHFHDIISLIPQTKL